MVRTSLIVSIYILLIGSVMAGDGSAIAKKPPPKSEEKDKKEGTRVLEVLDILFGKDEGKKK